jgi:hypothetical protein
MENALFIYLIIYNHTYLNKKSNTVTVFSLEKHRLLTGASLP